jgi:DNA replication protein DnaC
MTTDTIDTDLKTTLRRLKLGKLLDTLPERLATARQQKMTHQDFLVLLLSDEINRRESNATAMRSQRAHLEDEMQIERWDETAKVTFDRALLNELLSLRFLESHTHVVIVGPVGVGKTFFAHAIGHTACRLPQRGAILLRRAGVPRLAEGLRSSENNLGKAQPQRCSEPPKYSSRCRTR